MEKIGFQREALFRKSVLNQDSIIFGVFKDELRWEGEHKEKNVKK
jgi:RimJ/RimL family protein N-acetyltransferase